MTVKTRVILIPFWIEESMKRAGLSIRDCIDYQKIKPVVSTNDLLTFLAAQELMATIAGSQNGVGGTWNVSQCWMDSIPTTETTMRKDCESLYSVSYTGNYLEEVKARLFSQGTNGPDYDPTYEKPFIIYDLSPDVVGVVVYPGFFTMNPSKALQAKLVEAVLDSLCVYNRAYHEVASTPWFKRHLELLAPVGS